MSSKTGSNPSLSQLITQTSTQNNVYKPVFFNLSDNIQKTEFETLISNKNNLQVYDHIYTQVEELIKCLHPTIVFLPPAELAKAVENHFGDKPQEEYGVWVYYPWTEKLVHLLDEQEFALVRTNRNKHKITEKEQSLLSQKKIGVMGLSVGQSVSLTLAMERGFGELRIADFDELDLSNINRIRTGVYNLKIKKTVIVAREIAEIDPYLNVVCFEDGITDENLDDFLTKNGKLDLLIDECDSFDIKINSRNKAKALGIPVLMEGSDRGTIDIERFDLEPNRPVLHGMVEHLDMSKYKTLSTMDERIPYITAVTGVETLSPRMKASAVEIMATISTWPQLASAVTYGGGITADLSRKILLGNLSVSGRFFIDMDELISDSIPSAPVTEVKIIAPLQTPELEEFITTHQLAFEKETNPISDDMLNQLIEAAAKAPSGGNNQPWRWHYKNGLLHLFLEKSAAQAYLDPQYISSYISLGAAIENLLLTAANLKLSVNWQLTPQLAPTHIAWFSFAENHSTSEQEKQLATQIELRHTNRKIAPRQEIEATELNQLSNLVTQIPDAKLTWLTNPEQIKGLGAIATHTDLLRMFIPAAHEDFITREMRWNIDEVTATEDGIGIHTLDLSNNDQIGIRLLKDKKMIAFLQQINGGSGFKRLSMQQFMASSAIGLITMPKGAINSFIEGGMAAEKLWLGATALNLQIHPVNVPLIFFYKNSIEDSLPIPLESKAQLTQAEQGFKQLFSVKDSEQAIFMFRIFKATPSPERTIRKSTSKIFSIGRA
ncbi:Rv1355c family protein [Pedobacter sp. LMG 31464]|uniref:Rv1355c family protein n=1 Tax=Pedobacter planticolens TaxID=2679964 RepID=A0A923E0E7_9SPHI|nr:Rv1355c family protein [Pedobacter planticolens]MBB2145269.1 Rv1355c family protein [Pedobacter planticolens]